MKRICKRYVSSALKNKSYDIAMKGIRDELEQKSEKLEREFYTLNKKLSVWNLSPRLWDFQTTFSQSTAHSHSYYQACIQQLENSRIEIKNEQYTVSFELLPFDQKFVTIMADELSNSATYP